MATSHLKDLFSNYSVTRFRDSHRMCSVSICNIIKKDTLAQVLSCEFHKIFKNTFFYSTPSGFISVSPQQTNIL